MAQATTVYVRASAAATTSSNSGDLTTSSYGELAVDCDVTAASGTLPTLQFFLDRKGADGIYYPIWQSNTFTSTGQVSASIGYGMSFALGFGATVRLRWTIGGTTPSFTFSSSIVGK